MWPGAGPPLASGAVSATAVSAPELSVRYCFLGHAGVSAALTSGVVAWGTWLFRAGHKLSR